jgi:hypothetical protein
MAVDSLLATINAYENLFRRNEMDSSCRTKSMKKKKVVLEKSGFLWILLAFVLMSATPVEAKSFENLFNDASLKYREGKYKEALKLFQKANLLKNNADPESSWNIAQIYNLLGQFDETVQACNQLASIAAADLKYQVRALNLKGTALFLAATKNPNAPDNLKFLQAEETFRQILKINPKESMVRYNLAIALIWMHRTNEGIDELKLFINESDDQGTISKARRILKNPQLAFEKLAPDFLIRMRDGSIASLESLKGKTILLDFESSIMSVCQYGSLQQLLARRKNSNLILFSIGSPDSIIAGNAQCGASNWKIAMDYDARLRSAFSVNNAGLSPSSHIISTFILIDQEGIISYKGTGAIDQIVNEVDKKLNQILNERKDVAAQPANEKIASLSPPVLPENTFYIKIDPAKAPVDSIPQARPEGNRNDTIGIPKPQIKKASSVPVLNAPKGVKAYILEIKNWASFSDDLFRSYRNLEPCRVPNPLSGYSSRLEIAAWNDQGEKLLTNCSLMGANQLQKITFIARSPMKPGSKMFYLTIKDRLTGNTVQSDPVKIP